MSGEDVAAVAAVKGELLVWVDYCRENAALDRKLAKLCKPWQMFRARSYLREAGILEHMAGVLQSRVDRVYLPLRGPEAGTCIIKTETLGEVMKRNLELERENTKLRLAAETVVIAYTTRGLEVNEETSVLRAAMNKLQAVTGLIPGVLSEKTGT